MSVNLTHTIVHSRDHRESAAFLAHVLGLCPGDVWGPFISVTTSDGVTLDFATVDAAMIIAQHYAFLISDDEFDAARVRLNEAGVPYWADPRHTHLGEIHHRDGGRGLYFLDPSMHSMELRTPARGIPRQKSRRVRVD